MATTNYDNEIENEALIDAYHDGFLSLRDGSSQPHQPGPLADSWDEGRREALEARKVRVVMPERPEGYYHSPLDGE